MRTISKKKNIFEVVPSVPSVPSSWRKGRVYMGRVYMGSGYMGRVYMGRLYMGRTVPSSTQKGAHGPLFGSCHEKMWTSASGVGHPSRPTPRRFT